MTHYQSLSRTSERVMNFLEDYRKMKQQISYEDFEPVFQIIQNLFPEWTLMTCPVKHAQFRYISENCSYVLGFSAEAYKAASSPDFLFSRIHEDDVEALRQCFLYIDDFFRNTLPDEYPKMRCVFTYRFRKEDGSYIIVRDEKLMLKLSENDNLFYCIIKDISDETVFAGAKVDIFKQHITHEKVGSFKPGNDQTSLSKRETEVVNLLKRGLTNKEMAYHLNISQHTVRNMKQKLFEKYHVNNVVELLNKTIYYN